MMFLNEPSIQNYQLAREGTACSEDSLKFLWRVHQQQMHFQEKSQYHDISKKKLQTTYDIEKEGNMVMKF